MKYLQFGFSILFILGLTLSACAPQTVVETVVETVVVEKEGETVIETVVVEKEGETVVETVVVEVTPEAPEMEEAEGPSGSAFIGELEGPTIVSDPAMIPDEYDESPILAELVATGELPPVAERVGEEPLVIQPVHEIGTYGGEWHRGFTGPGDRWNAVRGTGGPDNPLFWDYTATEVVPNVAKGWEFSDDGLSMDLFLRKGMKWSDGEPFTADDFMFWYEDAFLNDELVPSKTSLMFIEGEPVTLEKIDDFTVRFNFPAQYDFFPKLMAGSTDLSGMTRNARNAMGLYLPKHYLSQYHPSYIGEEEANALATEEGFDNWVQLFKFKAEWTGNPDLPVLTPWVTVQPITEDVFIQERNPYYFGVDTEGNQLPYIDRVVFTLAENLEVINLRAIAGLYDFQARHLDIGKLPVFIENQEKVGYEMHLDPGSYGGDMIIIPNHSYDADPVIGELISNVDFRRALSLGIERDQINEIFWLGTGTPGSPVVSEDNPYNPGAEYRSLWATYDPDQANELLDSIGLEEKDSDGYRIRPDGDGRIVLTLSTAAGQFVQYTRIGEMIAEQWKEIGIDLDVKEEERSLLFGKFPTNELMFFAWNNDGSDHMFANPWSRVIPSEPISDMGPLYGLWYQSNGEEGKEPPPIMKEVMEKFTEAYFLSEEERVSLAQEIWATHVDQVWTIGVIGLGPAAMGVRLNKSDLGNAPDRQYNSPSVKNPSVSRPQTFFWKAEE